MRSKYNGYFTVEATFVFTICLMIIMAVLYTGLYVHDRMVLETVTQRFTARLVHMAEEEKWSEEEFVNQLKEDLKKRLFLLPVEHIDVRDGLTSVTVDVRYSLPISLGFLKRIWGGSEGERTEHAETPDIWPAKWKWDTERSRQND